MKLTKSEIELLREKVLSKFRWFTQAFITHFGSFERYDPIFHGELCDFLQSDTSMDKLIILPRASLKTTICTVLHPLWAASVDPAERFLLAGNSEKNSMNNVKAIKGIVENNNLYAALFPDRIPDFGKPGWSNLAASLNRPFDHPNATFEAAGMGTNVTGRHPTRIIEDDTVTPKKDQLTQEEMMPTRDDVEKAVGFHRLTFSLLDNPKKGGRNFICTRWAGYDAANYIMNNEMKPDLLRPYTAYDKPAIDPTTGKANYSFYDIDTLRGIKAQMGSYMFSMLYLNDPLSSEFMKIRPQWIRYYKYNEDKDILSEKGEKICGGREGRLVITVDPADPPGSKSENQCFSVGVATLNNAHGLFVLKYVRGKWTDVQLIKQVLDMADELGICRIKIEVDRYANMFNTFRVEGRKRAAGRYSFEKAHTRGRRKDEDRIMRIAALAEEGLLFLRHGMDEMEHEMYTFPNGTTNDLIDALAWHILDDLKIPKKKVVEKENFDEDMEKVKYTFSFDRILKSALGSGRENPFQRKVTAARWS